MTDIDWRYAVEQPITESHAMTAMCIWEAVLELHRAAKRKSTDAELYYWFTEHDGAFEGRQIALTLAPRFDRAYDVIGDDYHEAFDWEFIPEMLWLMFENHPNANVDQQTMNDYALEILRVQKADDQASREKLGLT